MRKTQPATTFNYKTDLMYLFKELNGDFTLENFGTSPVGEDVMNDCIFIDNMIA